MTESWEFVPLRTDPPPELSTALWPRSALALTILVTALAIVATDLRVGLDGAAWTRLVAVLHVGVVGLLIVWSTSAMANVDALVPPTRYTRGARGAVAGGLWIAGFLAPLAAVAVVGRIGSEFADVEAFAPTVVTVAAVLVALFVAWLPFSHHVRQAGRIGAPRAVMAAWFWAPLGTFVGGLAILDLVYREGLSGPADPPLGVGAVYGLATGVFGWSTWRAVTVFDEVIDLRWQRWKVEWEQTLAEMAAQPPPPR